MSSPAPLAALLRPATLSVTNLVVGGGVAASTILHGLAQSPNPGKVLVVTGPARWPMAFPRHHLLGQSRQSLTLSPREFYDPKGRMTVDEHLREVVDHQTEAVKGLPDDADCIETNVIKITRQGKQLLVECSDGTSVLTQRLFMASGVGPERTLAQSNVTFENEISPKRMIFHEVTTALKSLAEKPEYWRNKHVTIYGGGATAAWIAEIAMSHSLKNILWVAKSGFEGANPGNRNSETLLLTEGHRLQGEITQLRYSEGADAPPAEDGVQLKVKVGSNLWKLDTDIVICALGSNPLAPTGVEATLGPLCRELVPSVGARSGVFAMLPDGSLFVVSSSLSHDAKISALIRDHTFPVLNPENRVVAGLAATSLSALDAVDRAESEGASKLK